MVTNAMLSHADSLIKAQTAAKRLHEHAEKGEWLAAQYQAEALAHYGIRLAEYFDGKQRGK